MPRTVTISANLSASPRGTRPEGAKINFDILTHGLLYEEVGDVFDPSQMSPFLRFIAVNAKRERLYFADGELGAPVTSPNRHTGFILDAEATLDVHEPQIIERIGAAMLEPVTIGKPWGEYSPYPIRRVVATSPAFIEISRDEQRPSLTDRTFHNLVADCRVAGVANNLRQLDVLGWTA